MSDQPRLLYIADLASGLRREMTRGVVESSSLNGCRLVVARDSLPVDELRSWLSRIDAILYSRSSRTEEFNVLQESNIPLIVMSSQNLELGLPGVLPDERRVGWLAGRHLIQRGCRHFAYVGMQDHDGSNLRRDGFAAALADHGASMDVQLLDATPYRRTSSGDTIRQDVARIPERTGVLAFNDSVGLTVLDALEQLNRNVPGDVAVVGIDNDELLCSISHPTLTSIDTHADRIGREAVAMALRLISGDKAGPRIQRVEPLGVVARGSTDLTRMVDDPTVRAALEWLDEQRVDEVSIDRLLDHLILSRSSLDRAFKKALGRTAFEEIRKRRLQFAYELATESSLSGVEIAVRTGFKHLPNLCAAFKSEFSQTLTEARNAKSV